MPLRASGRMCSWWYAAETSTVPPKQALPNMAPGAALPLKLFRTEIFLVEVAEIAIHAVAISCKLPIARSAKGDPTGGTQVRSRQAQGEVAAIERQDAGREVLETRRLRKRTRPRPVPRAGSGVEPAGRGPSPVQAAPVGDDQQHQG